MAADDLLLRQAPHSPQAEQAVLGSICHLYHPSFFPHRWQCV